jgi:purine-nucleoside phosphorylase
MFSDQMAYEILQQKVASFPEMVITLGSGWNKVLSDAEIDVEIPYKEIFGVEASVPGHEGKLVIATIFQKRVAFMQGRLHMYEGYSGEEATLPVRVFHQAGMKQMIVTAACGALNEKYRVGDFCLTSDLLTLFLVLDNPLVGPKFLDMSEVFDEELRNIARKVLVEENIPFHEGVYAYYHGPNFETPADKMALKHMGADVCGMSTAPETIMARWLGVRVLSLALVTNLAFVKHAHEDVIAAAEEGSRGMVSLLEGVVGHI